MRCPKAGAAEVQEKEHTRTLYPRVLQSHWDKANTHKVAREKLIAGQFDTC